MKRQFFLMAVVIAIFSISKGIIVQDTNAMTMSQIRLKDNNMNSLTVQDNGVGDLDGTDGAIFINSSIGNWNVVVVTAETKPATGSTQDLDMSLDAFNVSNILGTGSPEQLSIEFTDIDFQDLDSILGMTGNAKLEGITDGTVSANVWADFNNTPFGKDQLLASSGPFTSGFYSDVSSINFSPGENPYSVTLELIVQHDGQRGRTTSGELQVNTPVPEPATIALLGIGLAGLAGGAARRKWKKKAN